MAHDLAFMGGSKKKTLPKKRVAWRPPDEGVIKINVDAGYGEQSGQGSTGAVVRDHSGALIRAQAIWYEHAHSARMMEALAIRDGIQLAANLGHRNIILESDAEAVIKLVNSHDYDRADLAPMCQEISEISKSFISFTLVHVGREANEAAHRCARQASEDRRRCIWVNVMPSFLQSCIHINCNPPG